MQSNTIQIIIPLTVIPFLLLALWRIGLRRLKKYNSPLLGNIEVWQKYNGEKLLTINAYAQGVSAEKESIKKSYWFAIAQLTAKFCQNKKDPQILMLGLGAGTVSNLIAKLNPQIFQTLVEFDEFIIAACQKYFGLNKLPNHQLIQADAYKLMDKKDPFGKKFDVMIVDIFTGKPPYVSLKSNQPNFIEKLFPSLKKDGMIIFNRPGNTPEARSDSEELRKYLATVFKKAEILDINDPRGYRNNVIFASSFKS